MNMNRWGVIMTTREEKRRSFALMDAIRKGEDIHAKMLLLQGVDLDIQNGMGETPVMVALKAGNRELAMQLIDSVNVNLQDAEGNTPLIIASTNLAYTQVVKKILSVPAVDVNIQNKSGNTALITAAASDLQGSHQDIIIQLMASGADAKLKNKNGETARTIGGSKAYVMACFISDIHQTLLGEASLNKAMNPQSIGHRSAKDVIMDARANFNNICEGIEQDLLGGKKIILMDQQRRQLEKKVEELAKQMDNDIDKTIISFAQARNTDAAGIFADIDATKELINVMRKQQAAKPSGFRELADICCTLSRGAEVNPTRDFAKRVRDTERDTLQK
jgi:hypothetical protein